MPADSNPIPWLRGIFINTTFTGIVRTFNNTNVVNIPYKDGAVAGWLDFGSVRPDAPATGSWLSPDPYDGSYDLSNPQTLNRYSYVGNNPLSFSDPSGLQKVRSGIDDDDGGGGLAILTGGGYTFGSSWNEFGTYTTITSSAGAYTYSESGWNSLDTGSDPYNKIGTLGIISSPGISDNEGNKLLDESR